MAETFTRSKERSARILSCPSTLIEAFRLGSPDVAGGATGPRAAMELQLQNQMAPHPQELEALQSVDSLLANCRELLATSVPEIDQAA